MALKQKDYIHLVDKMSLGTATNELLSTNSNAENVVYLSDLKRLKLTADELIASNLKQVSIPVSKQESEILKSGQIDPDYGSQNEQNKKVLELRKAIEQNRFILHYQPQYAMENNRVVGMEALLRMQSEAGKLIRPDLFIPVAEQSGLIIPIGNWVINEACHQLARWQASDYQPVRMAINVSPIQLTDDAIIDVITQSVTDAGIKFSDLELEITERTFIENITVSARVLNQLSELGVRIAIDDFGTGYSALSYLTQLPLDVIKIDQSFVPKTPSDGKACRVIKGIVNLAKSLNLQVVVEGIETKLQQQFIASTGCEMGQGFGFSRPKDADQIESFLMAVN